MSIRIEQEIAENGVLTRLFLPDRGTQPACQRVAVHGGLIAAAEWAQSQLLEAEKAPEYNENG